MNMARITGALASVHDRTTRFGFVLAQVCLCLIVFSYTYETVSQYFFGAPTWWSNELVAYALCIGTFLAMPEVTRTGGHIAIGFLTESLGPRASRVAGVLIAIAGGLTCLAIAWISLRANISQVERTEMLVRVRPIPKIWISAWITWGFFSTGVHFLRNAVSPPSDVINVVTA